MMNDTGWVMSMTVRLGERFWRECCRYARAGRVIAELGASMLKA